MPAIDFDNIVVYHNASQRTKDLFDLLINIPDAKIKISVGNEPHPSMPYKMLDHVLELIFNKRIINEQIAINKEGIEKTFRTLDRFPTATLKKNTLVISHTQKAVGPSKYIVDKLLAVYGQHPKYRAAVIINVVEKSPEQKITGYHYAPNSNKPN